MQKIEHCDERVRRERRFPSSLNTGLGQKLEFFKTEHNNASQNLVPINWNMKQQNYDDMI